MAKLIPTRIIARMEAAQKELDLRTVCLEIYRKIFPRLEQLGWEELEACGFAVFSREINGVEYTLNMDMCQVLVHVVEQGETPEAINLRREIESLTEWQALEGPVKEWDNFRSQYWDF